MISFLVAILKYLVIMVILAVVGFCGGKVGVILRKRKDAKAVVEETTEADE